MSRLITSESLSEPFVTSFYVSVMFTRSQLPLRQNELKIQLCTQIIGHVEPER
jgi:hypothetical protein